MPSSAFLKELNLQNYEITPTGKDSPPRRDYQYKKSTSKYYIANFFGLNPTSLDITNTIYLTPTTVEDFLIYMAFNYEKFSIVIRVENETCSTLYGCNNLDDRTKKFIEETNATLYLNPAVTQP